MFVRESVRVGNKEITLETGRLAKQASGAVLVTMGETVLLVTVVSSGDERPGIDFFPLTCDYIEKTYAAGKIPGGFFKREARPRDYEVLTARLMDRPVRPLFPDGFKAETQIIASLWSFDKEHPAEVLALTGASAALHVSNIPWDGPIAGIRVGRVEGEFVAFPTYAELEESDLDITVACSKEAIVMVEGSSHEIAEQVLVDALMFAHESAQPLLNLIERLRESVGKPKFTFEATKLPEDLKKRLYELSIEGVRECMQIVDKHPRYAAFKEVRKAVFAKLTAEVGEDTFAQWAILLKASFEDDIKSHEMRQMIVEKGIRIGGRDTRTVRDIRCEVGVLPRTHGSAVFQRGETQALVTATLGTSSDEQKIDTLMGDTYKSFLLHYNFPPFCTGEVKRFGGVGRREVGHGNLAERALQGIIPDHEKFPYTTRIVSEVLESNGSSSMASVCGGTLSLMDAGVPIKAPVAGIAMGLIKEGDKIAVLSDILGDEDHMGDMDFKVCGTSRGITAIQMDIKVKGLSRQVLTSALEQAREGRLHILEKMLESLPTPREVMSKWAPRITTFKVKPDQIRVIIGSGGKTIKGIVDQTGAQINVQDDGTVNVSSADENAVRRAIEIIQGLLAEPEAGVVYKGTVKRITDFGAFVEILPNTDGLLHISEIALERIDRVEDVLKEGDSIEVKVLSVDRDGKVRLSRRALLPGGDTDDRPRGDGPPRSPRGRNDRMGPPRDRDRGGPPRDRLRSGPPRDRDRSDRDRNGPPRDRPLREPRVEMEDARPSRDDSADRSEPERTVRARRTASSTETVEERPSRPRATRATTKEKEVERPTRTRTPRAASGEGEAERPARARSSRASTAGEGEAARPARTRTPRAASGDGEVERPARARTPRARQSEPGEAAAPAPAPAPRRRREPREES